MYFYKTERIALFIDAANFDFTMDRLGWSIDFTRLRKFFEDEAYLVRSNYYTAVSTDRKLADWLGYHGYRVTTKQARAATRFDVEITVDMLAIASHVDNLVLFSGDANFRPLVEAIQSAGRRVTIVSTVTTTADALRRECDRFIEIGDLRERLERVATKEPALAV